MAVNVSDLLGSVRKELGRPYVFGAAGPTSFDCSGLMVYVFKQFGISLPRTSQQQAKVGTAVDKNAIQAGDLVFSDWGDGPNSHVGIATGPNEIISAPHSGDVVRTSALNSTYRAHITAVRRVGTLTGTVGAVPTPNGASTPVGGGLMSLVLPDSVNNFFTEADKVVTAGTWLFKPSNLLRLAAGVSGAACILLGVLFLSREVR